MRHNHGYRKLGRTSAHRKALLKNLAIALVENQKIETTVIKAKELQSYIEKLITKASEGSFNAHRAVLHTFKTKTPLTNLWWRSLLSIAIAKAVTLESSEHVFARAMLLLWLSSNSSKLFSPCSSAF